MTKTMMKSITEEYVTQGRDDYYSGITKAMINGKTAYKLKGKFLDDLQNNTFSGTNGEDAVEHIENFLKIINPLVFPNTNGKVSNLNEEYPYEDGEIAEIFMIETNIFDYEMPLVGNALHYQDIKWYEALEDGKLKNDSLTNKAIMEGLIDEDEESYDEAWKIWDYYENTIRNDEDRELNDDNGISNLVYNLVRDNASYHNNKEEDQNDEDRRELLGNPHQELSVC
ncbi:hypothetical protein Tco_0826542 [Tanacetum coccineum]